MNKQTAKDMPETPAPRMSRIEFAVPTPLLEEAKQLAAIEGWKEAELYRVFWERGYASYCEGSNKRLVNKKLREDVKNGELGN